MDLESRLRLERDVPAVEAFLASTAGELVHRDEDPDGCYWVTIQPAAPDTAPFLARVVWTVYPGRPPSLLFANEVGGSTTLPAAWPAAPGYRAPNDVCKPFTAEGRALHADWDHGPHAWRTTGNPFLYVVENLQDDIDRAAGRRAA